MTSSAIQKIVTCYNKRKGKKTFPIFDNEFLPSSKKLKIGAKDFIFLIKQEDMFDYNPNYFMSGGLNLDFVIMSIFSETVFYDK